MIEKKKLFPLKTNTKTWVAEEKRGPNVRNSNCTSVSLEREQPN